MNRKIILLVSLIFLVFMPQNRVFAALPSGVEEDDLQDAIDEFTDDHEEYSAGVMFAVFTPDEILYEANGGFSNIDDEIDVSEASVFEWGSITKLLTWISVMQLVEQGDIDLNEEITTYLPDDYLDDFEKGAPTMLDLMNHQGGFSNDIPDLFITDMPEDDSLQHAVSYNQPEQLYKPGEMTAYSNWGAALAGYIVEAVSGQPFVDYVHENILEPLDMNHTALAPDLSDNPDIRDQRLESAGYFPTVPSSADNEVWYMPLYPAGAAVSTLSDLVTFAQALFPSNGETPLFEDRNTLVSLFEPTQHYNDTDAPRSAHGLQITLFENAIYGHTGNTNAFSSNLMIDIEADVGYVVMINEAQETTYTALFPKVIFGDYMPPDEYEDFEEADITTFYTPLSGYLRGVSGHS